MNTELELEVFRAGDYGEKGQWSEEMLDQMAEEYRADRHEAPVTLDHAQTGPALGWVSGLKRAGDRLIARLRNLNGDLVELLRSGAFKKRSVEIYHALPETGKPYLKAVSFLGAGAPTVKGLRDAIFSDDTASTSFRSELGEYACFDFAEAHGGGQPVRGAVENEDKGDGAPSSLGQPAEITQCEPASPRSTSADFSELEAELRQEGRWNPRWEAMRIRQFFGALSTLDELESQPGQLITPAQWFADFLRTLPPHLPMGEAAPPRIPGPRVSIPQGERVSPSSIELHRRVVKLRQSRPELSYAEALQDCARPQ